VQVQSLTATPSAGGQTPLVLCEPPFLASFLACRKNHSQLPLLLAVRHPSFCVNPHSSHHFWRAGTITHSYPFCWRSDTPLVQLACPAWFVSVEPLKEKLLENNKARVRVEM